MSVDNPLVRLAAFPDPPSLIATYVAELATEEVTGPVPWDLGALPSKLVAEMPGWLDEVCRWLNETYAWQPQDVIPPCWPQHDRIVYEVAAFAFARIDAYGDTAGSAIIWHEQYARFVTRMNNSLGKAGDDCRVGKHEARPSRFALAAWPPRPSPAPESAETADAEPVEELL
ncbi:hypothetical protein ACIQ9Q_13920 [Streptomyces sp. NPDC094438]|uniref:hypothetical protein n=1 Tax=Streptomyces sp. NPDC094438 TaxID=3366061 RepID=UPI00381915EB